MTTEAVVNQMKRRKIRVTAKRRDVEYAPYIITTSRTPVLQSNEIQQLKENNKATERTRYSCDLLTSWSTYAKQRMTA